jgi:hypothetical protein
MAQFENERFYRAESENGLRVYLNEVCVDSIQQVSRMFRAFQSKVDFQCILNPIHYFALQEGSRYIMVYIMEEVSHTMEQELSQRRALNNPFLPKELALITKIIFKSIMELW